ncbi:MAG: hypothetical protein ACXADY_24145 [Candidatus Hodarchaeales archaeon]
MNELGSTGHVVGDGAIPFLLVQFSFAWLFLLLLKSSMTDAHSCSIF